jgi:hypothetical protein
MERIWLKHYPPGVPHDVDLSQYAGRFGQLRFRYATDPLVDGPGAWVDNVTTRNVVVSVPDVSCQ